MAKLEDFIHTIRAEINVPRFESAPEPGYKPRPIGEYGECMRLATASVLGVLPEQLDHIDGTGRDNGSRRGFWQHWMQQALKHGYIMKIETYPFEIPQDDSYWIAAIESASREQGPGNADHAVVMKGNTVHYDPNNHQLEGTRPEPLFRINLQPLGSKMLRKMFSRG